jgi:DNA-binding response OmpR family regulator
MRILAVDDDVVILEVLEHFLTSIDYPDRVMAASPAEALRAIEQSERQFDCILLDINMPGTTGIELIPQIRAYAGYEFTPVIMLTALDDRRHIAEAFVAGAWDYIVKPFELFELETRLHSAELRNNEMRRLLRWPDQAPADLELPLRTFHSERRPLSPTEIGQSGLVGEEAFENCLQRIADRSARELGVLVMQIADYDHFRQSLPPNLAENYVKALACNLTSAFTRRQGIVSYQGEGTFVALSFVYAKGVEAGLRDAAREAVRETDAEILPDGARATEILLSEVLSHELPGEAEPLYMLNAARSQLESRPRRAG